MNDPLEEAGTQQPDGGAVDGDAGLTPAGDGSVSDGGSDAAPGVGSAPELVIGSTASYGAPKLPVATIIDRVANVPGKCRGGSLECNGGCLDPTKVGSKLNGCTVVTGAEAMTGFAFDGASFYYTSINPDGVYKLDPTTGQSTQLNAERLAVVGLRKDEVLVRGNACGGTAYEQCLYGVPKQGGAPRSLLAGKPARFDHQFVGDHMYWTAGGAGIGTARRTHFDTGVEEVLFSAKPSVERLLTDGTWAFTTASAAQELPGVVTRLDLSSPAVQIFEERSPDLGQFLFHGKYLYWRRLSAVHPPDHTSSFERVELGKSQVEAIATLPFPPYGGVKIFGDSAYFVQGDAYANTLSIYRMPVGGEDLERIATLAFSATGPIGWHVTGDALYVAVDESGAGILKIELP